MSKEPTQLIHLFTDGACSRNPGPGGWAFVLRDVTTRKEMESSGGEASTTNNRMELMAVIQGLKALRCPCHVTLYSDSSYVGNGITEWISGWKQNGWRRKERGKLRELKNADLWRALDSYLQVHRVTFKHVKGHSGHSENERCDQLAVAAANKYRAAV